MFETGKCAHVAIIEMRWNTFGRITTATGESVLYMYSGKKEEAQEFCSNMEMYAFGKAAGCRGFKSGNKVNCTEQEWTEIKCSFWTYASLGDIKFKEEGVHEGFVFTCTCILGLFCSKKRQMRGENRTD